MEERNTIGDFLSKNSSVSTWETPITAPNGNIYTHYNYCDIMFQVMFFLCFMVILLGMAANATVLWFLGFHMHRKAFSVYMLNLAMADFLFLCFEFVFCLLVFIDTFYAITIHIALFSIVLLKFAYFCGLSILSAISIERCLSVMWPIWYRCQRPRHTSAVMCALLWALSLLLTVLDMMARGVLFNSFDMFWCQTFDFIIASWSIALFVVLCGSNLTLLVRIFCGSHRIPVTRLYVTLALTVLFFLIFGLPLGIYCHLYRWIGDLYYVQICDVYVILFLSCVNSSANPIIYFFVGSIRHRRFQRKTLKLFLQRALQDTPEEEEDGERGSSGELQELETV
ncbi:mas-related G-protein coupled receptor member B2-like [Mesocricetus auratus]|uniref:Mas-related G-protein coupled receptor member B2-like n=1 Tax=Mesocricetus auratus TaxID=10036 RepID=A0ABM2WG25_MESAU|nr:mas-related G-protein coupled receptor member B2-like [Mesocricetus auratus]XP_040589279.1 mas-related G-protein coupled receptor member B2-like [Mesocricetus auratus]XP_040589280.1 mas-related G-protein coupled receptor member B2-like [Mesocricetus auratus]XP_040589281.1 mas-related G-protein coupled receptor member B2-like [Mesocricetus auratus]